MKKVNFLDTVAIYYYNKDKPIQNSKEKYNVKTTKLYNLKNENESGNYKIVITILVILSIIYIIIIF